MRAFATPRNTLACGNKFGEHSEHSEHSEHNEHGDNGVQGEGQQSALPTRMQQSNAPRAESVMIQSLSKQEAQFSLATHF